MRLRRFLARAAVPLVLTTLASASAWGALRMDMRHLRSANGSLSARDEDGWQALGLDPGLQREAERLIEKSRAKEAAIVVSDPRTGRVLVWATHGGGRDLVSTPTAPSASLFKVVTAAALLETGHVTRQTRQCWSGGEKRIEEEDLDDDRSRDDRCSTVGDALGHSVNLVFARLALKHLSPDQLRDEASQLGIGSELPIDDRVPQSSLHIPDDRLGFARAAAGFWNGKLSPLSALFLMQTIANKGERVALRLRAGDDVKQPLGRAINTSTATALTRMLEVTTRSGTSAKVFHHEDGSRVFPHLSVAGKTGTLIGGKPTRMYSWFAGFAPSRTPEIAVSVMLANDVSWWTKANAVAKDLLSFYFERKASRSSGGSGSGNP